jgi:hypothetical protein
MRSAALLLLLVSACGGAGDVPSVAGPPAANVELALEVSWDTDEPRDRRPRVHWCADGADPVDCGPWTDQYGNIVLPWHDGMTISASAFPRELASWASYVALGRFDAPDLSTREHKYRFQLALAGL